MTQLNDLGVAAVDDAALFVVYFVFGECFGFELLEAGLPLPNLKAVAVEPLVNAPGVCVRPVQGDAVPVDLDELT